MPAILHTFSALQHCADGKCLPELKKLVTIVKTTNAVIHCPSGLAKMTAELLACAI